MENQDNILYQSRANFFGQLSKGHLQLRGSGKLSLTENELFFTSLGKIKLVIPYSKMRGIETPRSFLGKSKGGKLLKIIFENELGEIDEAAWLTGGLQTWIFNVELVMHKDDKFGPPIEDPDVFKNGHDVSGINLIATSRSANFFGQESLGLAQLRGLGYLMITDEEIFFELRKGSKREFKKAMKIIKKIGDSKVDYDYETPIIFRLPISNIIGIEKPDTFLTKSFGRPLLKLVIKNNKGEKDSFAWWVPRLEAWVETISKLINI